MNITVLDAKTLGDDISIKPLQMLGNCEIYGSTQPEEVSDRISNSDVVVLNKIKLGAHNLNRAAKLKLICVTATGYDNIDTQYCREKGIAVCNVVGYSSHSVALVTVATVLTLLTHLYEYNDFVRSGEYTKSGVANRLSPVYNELYGKTWGIVGFGNIGREVAGVASAFGCDLLVCKRTPVEGYNCTDIDTLCRRSDIITIHTPLNDTTEKLINGERLAMMKENVVLVNEARGAVTDEQAVAEAVMRGKIGAFGCDVYSKEPFGQEHPFYAIKDMHNVLLTPHMAWGGYEARVRCIDEVAANIRAFSEGRIRNRVELEI